MNNKYSEVIGSFLRVGKFPLEANYIFQSEEQLREFYDDPINQVTLHEGLFRIVSNESEQSLYWVVNIDGNLVFKKLIKDIDINQIETQLLELQQKLEEEVQNRIEADNILRGTESKESLLEDLNDLKKISEAVKALQIFVEQDKSILQNLIGTDKDRPKILEYLQTLPYESLTQAYSVLHKFISETDSETNIISTLPELQAFLEGYTDSDTLADILEQLYNRIEGSPLPSENLRTLRGLEDSLILLGQVSKSRMDNLQVELDTTQTGIGLNQDGSFSPDKSTNFISNATSITDALRELDRLLKRALEDCNIEKQDTDTLNLAITRNNDGVVLSGNVVLNSESGNQIINRSGLYHHTELEYSEGILTLKVNGNIINVLPLGVSAIVNDGYYSSTTEEIVIDFALQNGNSQIVRIPVGALIREWEVDNTHPSKVVELSREEVYGGGADKLSADVRISDNRLNILERDGNRLLVRGVADNIIYEGETTVKDKIDLFQNQQDAIDALNKSLQQEIERSTEKDDQLSLLIDQEKNSRIEADNNLEEILAVTVEETTPETGLLKTYCIKQNNITLGTIDIPKDKVLNSGQIITATNEPGLVIGNKYIELIISNQDTPVYVEIQNTLDSLIESAFEWQEY